ncbi:MAG: hypothetical protein MK207_14645 [Saprospiraceae bacterium]|nr:hypothetical protein [Saprospiraceae bacterium]
MKNILVISYSQTGQLNDILDCFLIPFKGVEIDRINIQPREEFVFPWISSVFFDTMPETVLEEKIDLMPYDFRANSYDLIILGYQPWFLSPSLPISSLLQDSKFLAVLNNTPIVTVIGSRNMWINSQISVVNRIESAGGRIVANVPFIDRHQNLLSALSILHWMLTGKKERKWGFLPLPGVSRKDIESAEVLAEPVTQALHKGDYLGLQERILKKKLVDIHPSILFIEMRAKRLFIFWANLIKRKSINTKKRNFWVAMYKYYLIFALFVVSPIVLAVYTLLVRPIIWSSIKKNKEHFLYLGIER